MNICPFKTTETAFRIRNPTESEVLRTTMSLETFGANDMSSIDAVMLKELSSTLTDPFTEIINLCWRLMEIWGGMEGYVELVEYQ